jgi:hypothetical protein
MKYLRTLHGFYLYVRVSVKRGTDGGRNGGSIWVMDHIVLIHISYLD